MSDRRPIGAFDSGLGGLSVVKELQAILPHESIVYFGDTGRVPYGSRSPETIRRYAKEDEAFLLSKDVKLVIAACGTVSSVAADTGKGLPVPFLEVVTPAAHAAVTATKNRKIGILGTTATIQSKSYETIIRDVLPECEIVAVACPLFVPLVENGWIQSDNEVTVATAKRYLKPLIEAGVDTVILGCTHFPVLSSIIGAIMGEQVTLINTGKCAAEAAARYLAEHDGLTDSLSQGVTDYYVSDHSANFSDTASILLGCDIKDRVQYAVAEGYGDGNVK